MGWINYHDFAWEISMKFYLWMSVWERFRVCMAEWKISMKWLTGAVCLIWVSVEFHSPRTTAVLGRGLFKKDWTMRWPPLLGLNASILVRSAMFFAPTLTMSLYFSRWMSVLAVIAPNGAPESLKRSGLFILNVK
jgi:hypothetical protein